MHINNNDLEKFQNDVMNTDEMISFLEHLDQCDYCLEQLIEHSEQDTQTVAPAYMKETIMKRATAPDTRARKAAVDTTHKMRIFYEGLRTVVGVALALVMLLSLGQANFFTPQVPKSATGLERMQKTTGQTASMAHSENMVSRLSTHRNNQKVLPLQQNLQSA